MEQGFYGRLKSKFRRHKNKSMSMDMVETMLQKRGVDIALSLKRIINLEKETEEIKDRLERFLKGDYLQQQEEKEYMILEALDDIKKIYDRLINVEADGIAFLTDAWNVIEEMKSMKRITWKLNERITKLEEKQEKKKVWDPTELRE